MDTFKITLHPNDKDTPNTKYNEIKISDLLYKIATAANEQGKQGYSLKSIYYGAVDFKDAKYVSLFFARR